MPDEFSRMIKSITSSFEHHFSPPEIEDAIKAIEALAEIIRDELGQRTFPDGTATPMIQVKVTLVEKLNALQMGCEAIRYGSRTSELAQAIIARPLKANR